MENKQFPSFKMHKQIKSMIKLDFRRMFTMPLFYIMIGIAFIIPILIIVMTSMMAGTESINPVTNEVKVMEQMFTSAWQIFGTIPSQSTEMTMDVTTMCNIDMMYFAIGVLVCIFVGEDFRSGYSKCLFTVRSNKKSYVISKTIISIVSGCLLILAFTVGALIAAGISSLSFELIGINIVNIIMCIITKMCLVAVFTPIFLTMSVIGKQRMWLSILLALGVGMLLFMMVSIISPLNATIMNVVLSLAGGLLFSVGLGKVSNLILKKTTLI